MQVNLFQEQIWAFNSWAIKDCEPNSGFWDQQYPLVDKLSTKNVPNNEFNPPLHAEGLKTVKLNYH